MSSDYNWRARLAAMMTAHVERKQRLRTCREAFRTARAFGLPLRHARKLARAAAQKLDEPQREGICGAVLSLGARASDAICELDAGHRGEWHEAPNQSGLPSMRWRAWSGTFSGYFDDGSDTRGTQP